MTDRHLAITMGDPAGIGPEVIAKAWSARRERGVPPFVAVGDARAIDRVWTGPSHKVDRVLGEGDEVAGFRVVHAPGHAPGEVIFFRDSDRVAICGDVVRNMSFLTAMPGVRQPPDEMTYDPAENRRSIRKLAALEPILILPGHGPEITDMGEFERFVAALPVD